LRFGACLGTWLALLGHWGDLPAFARDLTRLKAKELPHLPQQLLELNLYRLYRLGTIFEFSISRSYRRILNIFLMPG
jgi:hypothetical protein